MMDYDSLFNLSYSICIVGSKDQDKINACIVNTVFQITPEPATIAISVNKENHTHDFIEKSGVFSVSVVSEDAPMKSFGSFGFKSGKDCDKFANAKYRLGETGCPILEDDMVCFIEARVTEKIDVHTHTVFIAEIVACENINASAHPMTYAFYRDTRHGKTPRKATTFHEAK